MPTMVNTFQAQTPFGQALQNISQMMFTGAMAGREDPTAQSTIDYNNARTLLTKQQLMDLQNQASGRAAIGQLIASLQPTQDLGRSGPPGPQQTVYPDYGAAATQLGSMVSKYGLDPQDYGDLYRFTVANSGAPDDVMWRALLGAGQMPGTDNGMSMGDRENIRATDAANKMDLELAKIGATPQTESQVIGGLIQQMLDNGEIDARGRLTLANVLDAPDIGLYTGEGDMVLTFDRSDPNGVFTAAPGVAGPGELTTMYGVTPLGDTGGEATATQQNLESEAANLGITVSELTFVKRVEAQAVSMGGVMAWLTDGSIPQETKDAYQAVVAKMTNHQNSIPVPDGLNLIEP